MKWDGTPGQARDIFFSKLRYFDVFSRKIWSWLHFSIILGRVVLTVLSRANVLTPVSLCELGVGSRYTVLVESRGGAPENFREIKAIYHIFLQYRLVKNH